MKKIKLIRGKLIEKAIEKFVRRYGDILELTKIVVQVEAVTALAQFYDP